MAHNINSEEVKYLENLVKVQITEDKRVVFAKEFEDIINYFEELRTVNFSDIEDIISLNKNVMREDHISNLPNQHKILSLQNASDKLGDYYKVSQVIKQ